MRKYFHLKACEEVYGRVWFTDHLELADMIDTATSPQNLLPLINNAGPRLQASVSDMWFPGNLPNSIFRAERHVEEHRRLISIRTNHSTDATGLQGQHGFSSNMYPDRWTEITKQWYNTSLEVDSVQWLPPICSRTIHLDIQLLGSQWTACVDPLTEIDVWI